MLETAYGVFLKEGLLGAIVLILGFIVYKLAKKVDELQEKRIAESRESVKVLEQNTSTLDTLTEVVKAVSKGNG